MPRVFFYGAQMLHPESVARGRVGVVDGYAVDFTAVGVPVFEPAFANLEAAPGQRAHGVVTELSDAAWAEVRAVERSYRVTRVRAALRTGEVVECVSLTTGPRAGRPGRPSARYARLLVEGARAHGLPPEVVARYERAAADGSRISLRLRWLRPLALRFGLRAVAVGLALCVALLIALLLWALTR
ncbi:MAG: gamma-glutamylcyclotransferase [Myxococcales bacterium]|nr:gamma-glutamylcyclotransferase [Myxococcales bacterium]